MASNPRASHPLARFNFHGLVFVALPFIVFLLGALITPSRLMASPVSTAPQDSSFSTETFAARFRAMASFRADSVPHSYIAFGDVRGYVNVCRKKGSGFVHAWSTFSLGSPVKEILADDIDADGTVELMVITSEGRLFVFDTGNHQLVWENHANDFVQVSTLLVDQLYKDPPKELILFADSRLMILGGEKMLREYQSADTFDPTEYMVIGDVDNDGEKEVVLDSGFVVNARTLNIEWQTDYFGSKLALFDLDGDGVDELISESTGGGLRVYDLDIRQEKSVF